MAKKEKHFIEKKFLNLKTKFKAGELTIEQIDQMTSELIAEMAVLTVNNISDINGTPLDLYKDRVFWIVEKAGLLPPYRDEDDDLDEDIEIEDNYYNDDDDFDFEIDDSKFYR